MEYGFLFKTVGERVGVVFFFKREAKKNSGIIASCAFDRDHGFAVRVVHHGLAHLAMSPLVASEMCSPTRTYSGGTPGQFLQL